MLGQYQIRARALTFPMKPSLSRAIMPRLWLRASGLCWRRQSVDHFCDSLGKRLSTHSGGPRMEPSQAMLHRPAVFSIRTEFFTLGDLAWAIDLTRAPISGNQTFSTRFSIRLFMPLCLS